MIEQAVKPVKYIRFNASSPTRPTLVHIASGKPFELKPKRYGRYSTTACGKEYEMDDFTTVKSEYEIKTFICQKCAEIQAKGSK